MKKLLRLLGGVIIAATLFTGCAPSPTATSSINCSQNQGMMLSMDGPVLSAYFPPTSDPGNYYVAWDANADYWSPNWQMVPSSTTFMPLVQHVYPDESAIHYFAVDFANGAAGGTVARCVVVLNKA